MKKTVSIIMCLVLVFVATSVVANAQGVEKVISQLKSGIEETIADANEGGALLCKATEDQSFVIGEIMVAIKKEYSQVNKVWNGSDFPGVTGIVSVIDLTKAVDVQTKQTFSEQRGFHQLLKIEINCISKADVIAGIKVLEKNDKVLFAEPNYIIEPQESVEFQENGIALANSLALSNSERFRELTNDPLLTQQNGIFLHNVDKVWNAFTKGSSSITVGVLDTGIDSSHPDLQANLVSGYSGDLDSSSNTYTSEHGTGVASIIGAKGRNDIGISGVCQNIKIKSYRITDSNNNITSEATTMCILKATVDQIPIINYSVCWTGGSDNLVRLALSNYDGLFVCCAGNDGKEISGSNPYYPAFYQMDNVIVVGGIEQTNGGVALWDDSINGVVNGNKSCYSSTYVDIMALANNTYACNYSLSEKEYGVWAGTSIAAPFVTGTAALLLSYDSTLTAEELKQHILLGAKTFSGLDSYCSTGSYLDAYGAFLHMLGEQPLSLNLQVKPIKPSSQNGTIWVYNFEIYHQKPYARLTEIVIPDNVRDKIISIDLQITNTAINVELFITPDNLLPDFPLIEFHFITYYSKTYGTAYVALTSGTHMNTDGDNVVQNMPHETFLVGDVNFDEVISALDVLKIQQYFSGNAVLTESQKTAADVNGDFQMTLIDSVRISEYLTGGILSFY